MAETAYIVRLQPAGGAVETYYNVTLSAGTADIVLFFNTLLEVTVTFKEVPAAAEMVYWTVSGYTVTIHCGNLEDDVRVCIRTI